MVGAAVILNPEVSAIVGHHGKGGRTTNREGDSQLELPQGRTIGLRVNQVDLVHRTIRLNPGETKNDEGRMAVTSDEVYTLISACIAGKQSDDFVFTRNSNRRVKDFRQR